MITLDQIMSEMESFFKKGIGSGSSASHLFISRGDQSCIAQVLKIVRFPANTTTAAEQNGSSH